MYIMCVTGHIQTYLHPGTMQAPGIHRRTAYPTQPPRRERNAKASKREELNSHHKCPEQVLKGASETKVENGRKEPPDEQSRRKWRLRERAASGKATKPPPTDQKREKESGHRQSQSAQAHRARENPRGESKTWQPRG